MKHIPTSMLDIAYEEGGPTNGEPVLLLHGWPDDATAWRNIAPALEDAGYRWVAPWLRGFGATSFLSAQSIRDGSGVAVAQDAIDLADALGWERFSVVGHDWGGRAAYLLAALAPERISSIASLAIGYAPRGRFETPGFSQSQRWWYQWFMTTDGGAHAIRQDPLGFARIQWENWSPAGWFDEETFRATAKSFLNPDWANITLHGYRSRWRAEPLDSRYEQQRQRIAGIERLTVPTLMIQGTEDYCDPPGESEGQGVYFENRYTRMLLDGVGHFPARENPTATTHAILDHLRQVRR